MSDCVTVVEHHLCVPNIENRSKEGRAGLIPLVVTVVLEDFIKARSSNTDVPETATELCGAQSVAMMLARGKAMGVDFYYLTFDQNESFMGHILDRQNNRKARKHLEPIAGRIEQIDESDMRDVPALQMADLFAWSYSHKRKPIYPWQHRMLSHAKWVDDWYDYDAIAKVIPGVAALVKSWALPRRRPTR
jgi:hypothetical protein